MKRLIIGLVLVILLLGSVACGSSETESSKVVWSGQVPAPAVTSPGMTTPDYSYSGKGEVPLGTEEERMIVRTGDMTLVVEGVVEARDEITRLAVSFDGYVVSSWVSGEDENIRGNISIRVPDDKYESVVIELRDLAVRVKYESTSSEDVTEQYVDLQSRLENAEATERQYLAILEKAEEVEDILRVYDSLSQIRYEIEQIKGRMQYLERTSAMSLISVRLEPAGTAQGLVRAGWSAWESLKSAVRGIVTFGQWLGTLVIWLLVFSPLWGAIVGVIYWRLRKKRAKRKGAA